MEEDESSTETWDQESSEYLWGGDDGYGEPDPNDDDGDEE